MATTASSFTDTPYEFRTGRAASYITVSTGILPSTKFEPSTFSMTKLCPRPDSERGTGSRYSWAHSGFAYNVVVAVQGGAPPFRFVLLSGPSGATLTAESPAWNPNLYLWGRINWPSPSGTGTFKVRVYDQEGNTAYFEWTCVTDNTKFRFLDASAGSDANNGILVADGGTGPWQTMNAWTEASTASSTYQNLICVYRTGTYNTAAGYGGIVNNSPNALIINENKPRAHIRYPGETVTWNLDGGSVSQGTTPGVSDLCLAVATTGSPQVADPKLISSPAPCNRMVLDRLSFSGIVSADITGGTDNNTCIDFAANNTSHKYVAIIDTTWADLPRTSNGFSNVDMYAVEYAAILGGQATNNNNYMGIWIKGPNDKISVWGVDLWDETNQDAQPTGATTINKFHLQHSSGNGGGVPSPFPNGPVRSELGYCRGNQADGTLNQQKAVLFLDSNDQTGPVNIYRMTVAGRIGSDGRGTIVVTCDTSTGVDASTNVVTHTSSTLTTGEPVLLTTAGSLPGGLSLATRYYIIAVSATTSKFATSLANALAGTAVDITSAGSGTMTMTVYYGHASITRCLQYCDAGTPITYVANMDGFTGNITNARSQKATDLLNGALKAAGPNYSAYYGLVGAEVAAS